MDRFIKRVCLLSVFCTGSTFCLADIEETTKVRKVIRTLEVSISGGTAVDDDY
ncbi:MAG: hypothetical protein Q7W55_13980 [Pseudohongiella sp.]|nr:hypothetical protein [Pseudohongiella sp.]MDO9518657.1 hypothetical protein [Pseudohongiella sp.]MDP2128430.1 hypothetical protein [Pseudohongiella sp.]